MKPLAAKTRNVNSIASRYW